MQRFKEERVLGAGGFGRAVLVHLRSQPSQKFALKVMECGRDLVAANRALAESTTLSALEHPNIVRVSEVFLHEQGAAGELAVCIVMEYASGGDLSGYLTQVREKRLGATASNLLLTWIGQLASALAYIHSKGIIHRDVKPSNIFLQLPAGENLSNFTQADIRLGDFGVAKVAQQQGKPLTMTLVGTPAYLAPEQLFTGDYGESVDIWGFGIICHEMSSACAEKSFLFEQTWMLGARVSKTPVKPQDLLETWPWAVRQVASACLSELPEHRPSASQVFSTLSSSNLRVDHVRGTAAPSPTVGLQSPTHKRDDHGSSTGDTTWLGEISSWLPRQDAGRFDQSTGITLSALSLVSSWLSEATSPPIATHASQSGPLEPSRAAPEMASTVLALDVREYRNKPEAAHRDGRAAGAPGASEKVARGSAHGDDLPQTALAQPRIALFRRSEEQQGKARTALPAPSARCPAARSSNKVVDAGKSTKMNVHRVIQDAIAAGAPAYNTGPKGHVTCAQIYTAAAQQAIEVAGDDLEARSILKGALHAAQKCGGPTEAAWALRHAFDAITRRPKAAAASKPQNRHVVQAIREPAGGGSETRRARPAAMARVEKQEMVAAARRAIQIGVPRFNSGDVSGCARVYQECCQALLRDLRDAHGAGGGGGGGALEKALTEAVAARGADRERAWALRGALDRVIAS